MTDSKVWPGAVSQGEFLTSAGIKGGAADRSDPRDEWLALAVEDPSGFARYIAGQNLAEQELWAARLSERAEARGLLGEFIQALRESGDPTAVWVANDFSAFAERTRQSQNQAEDSLSR
jgi:putative heme degradation protein